MSVHVTIQYKDNVPYDDAISRKAWLMSLFEALEECFPGLLTLRSNTVSSSGQSVEADCDELQMDIVCELSRKVGFEVVKVETLQGDLHGTEQGREGQESQAYREGEGV